MTSVFLNYCRKNKFEKNKNQIKIVELLDNFLKPKKSLLKKLFKKEKKLCFYLHGGVGVGKTMILNFFYEQFKKPKLRSHFNEFMINFHDFRNINKKDKSIESFVKELGKKYDLLYLDEFQVTNIVDAMILGKLFDLIFKEDLKVLISTNIKIDDLYKDGLQREQFLPFISIIKKNSIQKELTINEDYRKSKSGKLDRIFYPINEKTSFKINKFFRRLTKNKKKDQIDLEIKGRKFKIVEFYEGFANFDFQDLCNRNLGAEDYIKIAEYCKFVVIKNIPNFTEINSNQQNRFITLIDIFYDKNILLMISLASNLNNLSSSKKHMAPFQRTLSRLHELTSIEESKFSEVV